MGGKPAYYSSWHNTGFSVLHRHNTQRSQLPGVPFLFFCLLLLHVPILDFLYELQSLVVPLHFIDVQGQVLGKTDRLGQPLQKTPSHLHTDYATEGALLVSDPVYPKTGQHACSLSGTLPPNSAVTGYATEGALHVSAHLSTKSPLKDLWSQHPSQNFRNVWQLRLRN